MRINQFVALHSRLSRRSADKAIHEGRVSINNQPAFLGSRVGPKDEVTLDGQLLTSTTDVTTILLNKPAGYVCSRDGQGNRTIYELLPDELQHLQPVGRLDKDSCGLLLLTNDGYLANTLTHPSFRKTKEYVITLDKPLEASHAVTIETGVTLEDGLSALQLTPLRDHKQWQVIMHEGRNRQIRRTFAALGYKVEKLCRTKAGEFVLGEIRSGEYAIL